MLRSCRFRINSACYRAAQTISSSLLGCLGLRAHLRSTPLRDSRYTFLITEARLGIVHLGVSPNSLGLFPAKFTGCASRACLGVVYHKLLRGQTHGAVISVALIRFLFPYVRTIASLFQAPSHLVSQAAARLAPCWLFSVQVNQRRFNVPQLKGTN